MVRSADEAVKAALAQKTNTPGTCQLVTRTWLDSPSVGDVDRDGDADAVDGWKSEPDAAKSTNRKPPAGMPVAWSGGRNRFGHRALSLGPIDGVYMIRSTDAGGSGKVATVPLEWVEKNWGLTYLGWSKTIGGVLIPGAPAPVEPPKQPAPPKKKTSRGVKIDQALKLVKQSTAKSPERAKLKKQTIALLEKWPLIK